MSSAFDTIWRDKLIEITEEFFEEDKMRIIIVLLSDTNLEIKIQGAGTKPFKSDIGSPQGDVVSGPFFRIYFQHYLRKFREEAENFTSKHLRYQQSMARSKAVKPIKRVKICSMTF